MGEKQWWRSSSNGVSGASTSLSSWLEPRAENVRKRGEVIYNSDGVNWEGEIIAEIEEAAVGICVDSKLRVGWSRQDGYTMWRKHEASRIHRVQNHRSLWWTQQVLNHNRKLFIPQDFKAITRNCVMVTSHDVALLVLFLGSSLIAVIQALTLARSPLEQAFRAESQYAWGDPRWPGSYTSRIYCL